MILGQTTAEYNSALKGKWRVGELFDSTIEVALASRNRRRTARPSVGAREVLSFELGCSEAGCFSGTCKLAPARRLLPGRPSGKE